MISKHVASEILPWPHTNCKWCLHKPTA